MKNTIEFDAPLWLYPGDTANWHFISLPTAEAEAIKACFAHHARGWGSLRVQARIGETTWKTSIFPDKKQGTYLLPVKAEVRKKEKIHAGESVRIQIKIYD